MPVYSPKKSLVIAHDRKMQISITIEAAATVFFDLFIFAAAMYTAITYIIVSEEPKITEAHLPMKLSVPYFEYISLSSAVEALPDTGLTSNIGVSSDGMPILLKAGESNFAISSVAPLAFSMLIAVMSKTSVGISSKALFNPCFAPVMKLSVRSFFDISIPAPQKAMTRGIARDDM